MEEISKLIDRLFTVGERLSSSLRQQILDLGPAIEVPLIAIVDDDALYALESRGQGYAPLHALKLLGELRSTAAIPRLLKLLETSDHLEMAHGYTSGALRDIGEPVMEPCLAAYAATSDEKFRADLACVLAECGARDERIFEILVDRLPRDRTLSAGNFALYGDARALPHLSRVLDEYVFVKADSPFANHDVIELCAAIEDLGGQLTEAQERKRRRAQAPGDRFRALLDRVTDDDDDDVDARPPPRPGRNEPCYCGSGKKYKKCHLPEDENRVFT